MRTLTKDDLLELAGSKSYDRGIAYVSEVEDVTADPASGTVRGTVTGAHPYRVELTPERNGVSWYCDCPWSEEGNFCKHCVALGLVHLFHVEHGLEVSEPPAVAGTRSYLESLTHGELVDLVLSAAAADASLRHRLEIRAAARAADGAGTAALRPFIDRALRVHDFVDYGQAREYAGDVASVAEELEGLVEEGLFDEAEELSRHAIERLGEYMPMTDDSAGHVGEAACRVVDVHVEACAGSAKNPVGLAQWLLNRQLDGSGVPELLLSFYSEALGEEGLEHYGRELVRVRATRLSGDWNSYSLMSEFARVSGDVDLLVRVYAEEGPRVNYAGIVDALHIAGRRAEALEWAEKGLSESEGRYSERLVDHVLRAYRETGRWEDLLRVRWEMFERSPEPRLYRALCRETPEPEWPAVRDRALAVLGRSAASRLTRNFPCTLVEVLLSETVADEAWAAAVEHGCDEDQWLRVAALREEDHPEDAIGVYLPRVSAKVAPTDPSLYPEAAELARKVHRLYTRLGRPEEAKTFVEGLRREHRRKRRFLAELDGVGL